MIHFIPENANKILINNSTLYITVWVITHISFTNGFSGMNLISLLSNYTHSSIAHLVKPLHSFYIWKEYLKQKMCNYYCVCMFLILNKETENRILYCFHGVFSLTIQLTNKCTNINYFIVFISIDVFPYTFSLYHSTQQHVKQHAYNQQQIQYHDSVHQVTNAAILNFKFWL
jgi:hypothetical protein